MSGQTKHIILGAGGPISKCLTQELLTQKQPVKWVSRRGTDREGVEAAMANLLDPAAVLGAVEAGSTVYLLAGLQYKLSVWQEQWPRVMNNVIEACASKNAKLLFFDNVYSYGKVKGPMTESSPLLPCSRKGEVRAAIAEKLMAEAKAGRLRALIARAADFYGPFSDATSAFNMMVLAKFAKGQSALWVGNPQAKHAFTYTQDCGKALWLLSQDEQAEGQVWHLPTAPAMTGQEFIDMAAKLAGVKAACFPLSRWMFRLFGLFDPTLREIVEMFYQFDSDYEFDSSKFTNRYSLQATSYEKGMLETLALLRQVGKS